MIDMKFLLDTNFLLAPFQFKVDVYRGLNEIAKAELFTLDLVIQELEKIAAGRGKTARYAYMAIHQLEKEGVHIIHTKPRSTRRTDAVLVKIAKKEMLTVCTQDRGLISRLKKAKVPVVSMRQKRVLMRR